MTIDFTTTMDVRQHASGNIQEQDKLQPLSADGTLLTPKQIRARARRRRKRNKHLTEQELGYLYQKPVEEWDLDELAHGRPRNAKGHFAGPKPQWVDRVVYEEAMAKYLSVVKSRMKITTVDALDVLKDIITDDNYDEKGKPIVPASTKLDAAKFLIEHVVGKPTQRIENDVSVKLQGILGQVIVNPNEMGQGYAPAHYPGVTMALATGNDEDDEIEYQ